MREDRHDGRRARGVAAVILAAGGASRYGAPKLLAPLDGTPLVQHVIDAANGSRCGDVVVVLGHGADEVRAGCGWAAGAPSSTPTTRGTRAPN